MTKIEREKLNNAARWLKESVSYLQCGRIDAGRVSAEEALNALNNALIKPATKNKAR
ncbi:hypothetical protein NXJ56_001028 [Salmonella enterica]|nr:hypothetical protein [Salmonella enterica]